VKWIRFWCQIWWFQPPRGAREAFINKIDIFIFCYFNEISQFFAVLEVQSSKNQRIREQIVKQGSLHENFCGLFGFKVEKRQNCDFWGPWFSKRNLTHFQPFSCHQFFLFPEEEIFPFRSSYISTKLRDIGYMTFAEIAFENLGSRCKKNWKFWNMTPH